MGRFALAGRRAGADNTSRPGPAARPRRGRTHFTVAGHATLPGSGSAGTAVAGRQGGRVPGDERASRNSEVPMGGADGGGTKIPWYSWLAFVLTLAVYVVVWYFVHGTVVAEWLRWAVTGLWVAATLVLGVLDKVKGGAGPVDKGPFDLWTISHSGAGLVLGVWYVPLVFVLFFTITWEIFEILVPGFGENEVWSNRATDVGSALFFWLVVVLIAVAGFHAPFPLVAPVRP
jgi:hypothetical protein